MNDEIKLPGDVLYDKPVQMPYGYIENGKTYTTVLGIKRKRLIPLKGPYDPKPGDLIIGVVSDVRFSGYNIFVNMPYDVSISSRGIRFDLDYNDIITAKISHVDEVKNITIDDVRRLRKGIVIKVPPVKVPRILGRNNSMISLIKDKTGCDIVVGNNGLVWISFHGNVELAVESIGKVVKEAHIPGLTNRMEQYLNKKKVN
ncbi:hypothetical protein J7J26_01390 [Candidatus Micrarchaeota archaeon]|nr:hypothetical protein [Candidatus Micrarchaeota archaeon]